MIYLYSGTPGSGKSLHVASIIWTKLRMGKSVIANFPIDLDAVAERNIDYKIRMINPKHKGKPKKLGRFNYVEMNDLSVDYLMHYAMKYHKAGREGQTLLIIDECACIFNSRAWDSKDRMKWIVFFQQHRKLGFNIILISQSDRLIDRQIRAFVEYDVKHRCVNNFKILGKIVGLLSGGKLFAAIEYWYGVREKCGVELFILNRRKAKIYDTFKIFATSAPADKGAQGRSPGGVSLSADVVDSKIIKEVI